MHETYLLNYDHGKLILLREKLEIPQSIAEFKNGISKEREDYYIHARLGDQSLLETVIFMKDNLPGGFFLLHTLAKILFIAAARDNLAFALGMGYFGKICSYAKYGLDIFENMD